MTLHSTLLFCLVLSVSLVSSNFLSEERTSKRPRRGDPGEGRTQGGRFRDRQQRSLISRGNPECQEGNPPGASYSGRMNVTASGRTCQVWTATEPHEHNYTEEGEHNQCRNPNGDLGGVWCYTTDPEKAWEHCNVPRCVSKPAKDDPEEGRRSQTMIKSRNHRSVSSQDNQECQKAGFAPGKDFSGRTNITASGLTCQNWAASEPHEHDFAEAGDHNYCRNPSDNPRGVWCLVVNTCKRLNAERVQPAPIYLQ